MSHQPLYDLLMIARLLLASAFIVAGVAKLLDVAETRRTLLGAGLHPRLADPAAGALPVVELGVGVALLSSPLAWWGAVAALALLAAFIATIAVAMARGRMPVCGCFGRLGGNAGPLAALARNEMLAALAALVVWKGWAYAGPGFLEWLRPPEQRRALAAVIPLAGVMLTAGATPLTRRIRSARRRPLGRPAPTEPPDDDIAGSRRTAVAPQSGLLVGTAAPRFESRPRSGGRLSLPALLGEGLPLLLIFSDPRCSATQSLLPMIARWKRDCAGCFTPIVIEEVWPERDGAGSETAAIMDAFRVRAVPSAVVVRADGRIGSALVVGLAAIAALAGSRRAEAVA
jgi:hypothetical protein